MAERVAPVRRLRYGVVGLGEIGRLHARFARENPRIDLVAVVDPDRTREPLARALGVPLLPDLASLLERGVAAVSVATPPHLHHDQAAACLTAGVHALVEKPLALRTSDADRLVALARSSGTKLGVVHQYRMFRSSRTLKRIVAEGTIGRVLRALWTWGDLRGRRYYGRGEWRATWEGAGGGVLAHAALHQLDLLCWILGPARRVAALLDRQIQRTQVEDAVAAAVQFESGALATFQASFNEPRGASVRQLVGDRGIVVVPEVRSLTFDELDVVRLGTYARPLDEAAEDELSHPHVDVHWRVARDGSGSLARVLRPRRLFRRLGLVPAWRAPLAEMLDGFAVSVLEDREPPVTAGDALPALELMHAIVVSAVRGRAVDLPLDRALQDAVHSELIARGSFAS